MKSNRGSVAGHGLAGLIYTLSLKLVELAVWRRLPKKTAAACQRSIRRIMDDALYLKTTIADSLSDDQDRR